VDPGVVRGPLVGFPPMAVLADLERLFERLFERSSARLFRTRLQELQVERRVERAMERARVGQGGRTVVPARYRVRLAAADLQGLAGDEGAEALAGRLADAALAFARAHGYHLPGRPTVSLVIDPAVERGTVEVDAVGTPGRPAGPHTGAVAPAPNARPHPSPRVPDVPVVAPRPVPESAAQVPAAGPVVDAPPAAQAASAPPAATTATGATAATAASGATAATAATAGAILEVDPDHRPGGVRGDGTETLVYRRPAPAPVSAQLRVIARDGGERTVGVDGTPLTLGRAPDNGLVLADSRVSRHHARLQARRGTLVFTDLESTNGSRVNGIRVDECALGPGDRVQVGDTVLLVEQLPG
jgi:hypothetical protein